jgi:uncharacterized membrane protein
MAGNDLEQGLSDQDRLLLLFGYLGPLAIVSLVASRREFVKWHAKQGLALSATLVLLYAVLRFVQLVADRVLWQVFGELLRLALWVTVVGIVVAMLVCIVRGLEGERFKLPMLGELADRL